MPDATRLIGADGLGGLIIEGSLTIPRPVGALVRSSVDGNLYASTNAGSPAYSRLTAGTSLGNLRIVGSLNDLPGPVANVITFEENIGYLITVDLDLLGDRIVLPAGDCAIIGISSETASLTSTGLGAGVPLITGTHTCVMQNIAIRDVDTALAIDGTTGGANVAYDWYAVNFVNVPNVGTIENFNNFIMQSSAFLNAGNLTFDGTMDTVAFETCLFENAAGATSIIVPATATVSRRLRIIYSSFVILGGETGMSVDAAAITNNESYILDTVNFGGPGTFLAGADQTSIKALFVNNVGITNSATVAHYFMVNNATATVIALANTPVKVAGTTSDGPNVNKFTQTANRATYDGNLSEFFQISVSAAMTSNAGNQLAVYVARNGGPVEASTEMRATANAGGRVESTSTFGVIELAPTDYIEIWIENQSAANNITVTEMQVIAKRIS